MGILISGAHGLVQGEAAWAASAAGERGVGIPRSATPIECAINRVSATILCAAKREKSGVPNWARGEATTVGQVAKAVAKVNDASSVGFLEKACLGNPDRAEAAITQLELLRTLPKFDLSAKIEALVRRWGHDLRGSEHI